MFSGIVNIYEQGFGIMGKKDKRKKKIKSTKDNNNKNVISNKSNDVKQEITESQKTSKQKLSTTVIQGIVTTINTLISITFIIFLVNFYGDFREVKSNVNNMKDSYINKIDLAKINSDITNINGNINSLKSDLNAFKNTQDTSVVYVPTNITLKTLSTATINNGTEFLSTPSWNDSDVIAKNPRTGRKYKAKSLRDKKILIPYKENGQDIYFFGQFNKYNHWDGDCIINVYSNNKLFMIMEGRYDNGTLISYKQVNRFRNASDTEVWGISERKVKENVNVGETFTYYKTKNKKSNFTQKNVEASDILSVLDFEDWLNTPTEGYYYGNTSNGSYNDSTGKSYLIKFNKDGTVRTLYYGSFQNGKFEDDTSKAWYIALDKENSTYVYYKGNFSNNSPLETPGNKRENITNEEIHKIIDNMHFNVKIKLYNDKNKIS